MSKEKINQELGLTSLQLRCQHRKLCLFYKVFKNENPKHLFNLIPVRLNLQGFCNLTSHSCGHYSPYMVGTAFQDYNSRFLPTFYAELKVFVHFSRFYKSSNITIITIFFSHDRLSQRYTSTSTLSKMNFIVISQCQRHMFIYKRLYSPSKCSRACSNAQSFPFFQHPASTPLLQKEQTNPDSYLH